MEQQDAKEKSKTLEDEFEAHYWRFHHYMDKSKTLLNLYAGRHNIKILKDNCCEAVPGFNECFIELLNITDERILTVL